MQMHMHKKTLLEPQVIYLNSFITGKMSSPTATVSEDEKSYFLSFCELFTAINIHTHSEKYQKTPKIQVGNRS